MNAQHALARFLEQEVKREEQHSSHLENDLDELKWNIQFSEKMFPNCILMLCNARHRNFRYISETCRDILGYSVAQLQQIMQEDFFSIVHPDELEGVTACFQQIMEATGREVDLTRARFTMHYRIRHANGLYLNIADEKIMIQSRNGKFVGFTSLRDTSTTHFAGVKLETFRQTGHHFVKANEYVPNKKHQVVTSREFDVIRLIQQGFNSQEIAKSLSLSIHTVKNHRKRLFKKMNVRNSLELVRQVQQFKVN